MTRSIIRQPRLVAIVALMLSPVAALARPARTGEVVIYDERHFEGRAVRLCLAPDQRMLPVSDVNHQLGINVASLELGEGVAVMLFPETEFTLPADADPAVTDHSLRRIVSMERVGSMILFRRDLSRPPGVYLVADDYGARFYPAPSRVSEQVVQHPNFVGTIPDIDRIVLETGRLGMGAVEVALYEEPHFAGRSVVLPPSGLPSREYALRNLGIDRVASMRVRLAATVDKPICGDQPGRRIDADEIALGGVWQSNLGLVYVIEHDRDDDDFEWDVPQIEERGKGEIHGGVLDARWKGKLARGQATGRVTEIDGMGRALRIEWDHGLVLHR